VANNEPDPRRDETSTMSGATHRAAAKTGFYELGFAAQMIVWATRKRLHMLAGGADDSHVARAFELANLEDLYDELMSVADVLACGQGRKIQLHAVSCPCLAPHEVAMIDTLAHLQGAQHAVAYATVSSFMGRPAARLVWPAMLAIAGDLAECALRVELCAPGSAVANWPRHALH
jgi:hypothetical protein